MKRVSFNDNWSFTNLITKKTKHVNLPHDAMLEEQRDPTCPNGKATGYFPGGKYVYSKQFSSQPDWQAKDIELVFGGIFGHSKIYVNDILVKEQVYGYSEIRVQLSPYLQAENRIDIHVDNSLESNSRWYTGSGIYRPVYLHIQPKEAIGSYTFTTLSYNPAKVLIETSKGDSSVTIYQGNERVYTGSEGEITIPNAQLWSDKSPFLYRVVLERGEDVVEDDMGILHINCSPKGLFLNGKETLLRGACIHHDNGILGATAFAAAEERKIRILKEAGFNAIRSAHNPCSKELLEACDKLGMYVIDEFCDGWYTPKTYHDYARHFEEKYRQDLANMVERDKNHPSLIMYSIGNEVTESAEARGVELAASMMEIIKNIDSVRPVTCGINPMLNVLAQQNVGIYKEDGKEYVAKKLPATNLEKQKKSGSAFFNALMEKANWFTDWVASSKKAGKVIEDIAETLDVLGLNYGSKRYDHEVKEHPERVILGTETLVVDLAYNWKRVKDYPSIIGDFVWTGYDHLGETGTGDWQYMSDAGLPIISGAGVVDILGNKGAENAYQRIVWGIEKKPYIAVRPLIHKNEVPIKSRWRFTNAIASWSWLGYEGQKATIDIFGDAESVELYQNEKKIGKKRLKDCKTSFKTTYQTGDLRAVLLDKDGRKISTSCLKSSTGPIELVLFPEKSVMKADTQDLLFIPIKLVGRDGQLRPEKDYLLDVELKGLAVLQAFGNAKGITEESYLSNKHSTYLGQALLVLRAIGESGQVHICIKHDELGQKKITIPIEE